MLNMRSEQVTSFLAKCATRQWKFELLLAAHLKMSLNFPSKKGKLAGKKLITLCAPRPQKDGSLITLFGSSLPIVGGSRNLRSRTQ